eukprot:766574-Hanusia_phi.AAC.1
MVHLQVTRVRANRSQLHTRCRKAGQKSLNVYFLLLPCHVRPIPHPTPSLPVWTRIWLGKTTPTTSWLTLADVHKLLPGNDGDTPWLVDHAEGNGALRADTTEKCAMKVGNESRHIVDKQHGNFT